MFLGLCLQDPLSRRRYQSIDRHLTHDALMIQSTRDAGTKAPILED